MINRREALVAASAVAVALGLGAPAAGAEELAHPGITEDSQPGTANEVSDTDVSEEAAPATEARDTPDTDGGVQPGTETAPADDGNAQPGTEAPSAVDNGGDAPTQPGTDAPAEPAAPVEPAPVQPGTERPVAPAPETTPEVPEVPAAPAQPAEPASPAAPTQPAQPAEPAAPAVDSPVVPAVDETDTPVEVTTPVAPSPAADQPATPAQPASPAAPAQPAESVPQPKPVPMYKKVLRQGAIKANFGDYSIDANYVTTPGQTVFNASASDGHTKATAPTVSYGTYHDGVAEIGVGTKKPSPVKLDPITRGVVDATNRAVAATPKPVREATKLPADGDYRIGTPAAGAHVAWKS